MDKTRVDQITEELQELIFSNEFEDGMRLDEISLSERFGVSRTPLREAFRQLALSGLVEQIPRRGVFVRQPGPVELLEMFEVMSEFEAICGKLAASRMTEKALGELQEANFKCRIAKKENNADAYYDENERFHQIIYREAGNTFMEQETLKLQKRLRPYRRLQLRLRGRMAQSMGEHEAIVKALVEGDAETVANVLRKHVSVQGDKFYQLMSHFKSASAG